MVSTELAISDYSALFVGIAALFAIAATVLILLGSDLPTDRGA